MADRKYLKNHLFYVIPLFCCFCIAPAYHDTEGYILSCIFVYCKGSQGAPCLTA